MRFLRLRAVMERVQLSAMTIWRHEKAGTFPRRVKLSRNTVAWLEEEIDQWIADRIKERDDFHAGRATEPSMPHREPAFDQR